MCKQIQVNITNNKSLIHMTLGRKIFLGFCIALFLIVVSLSGLGLYLYFHPEHIKPLIERSLSATTGSFCTIESLSYSFRPMVIEAGGIRFKPIGQQKDFSMEIRFVRTDMAVEGPFGRRSLILKNTQINSLYIDIFSENATLPVFAPEKGSPSFPARMLQRLIGLFFFRDIKFQSGEIIDGRISANMGNQAIQVYQIHAKAGTDKPPSLSFALEAKGFAHNTHLKAPDVNILFDEALNIMDLKLSGALQSHGMRLQSPELGIRRIDMTSHLNYIHVQKKLYAENLQVSSEGITLKPDRETMGSVPVSVTGAETLSMETGLFYDMSEGKIAFAPLKIHVNSLSVMEKRDALLPPLDIHLKAEGIFHLSTHRLDVHQLSLALADIAKLEGTFQAGLGQTGTVRLQIKEASLLPEKSLSFLPSQVKNTLKPIRLGGGVLLKGNIVGARKDEKWIWECDLESRLTKNPYAYTDGETQIEGVVSAVVNARGRLPDVIISAVIDGDQNTLAAKTLTLEPFKMHLSLSSRYPMINIKDVTIQIPRAKVDREPRDLLIEDIRVRIPEGSVDGKTRSVKLPKVRFDSSGLKNLLLFIHLQESKINLTVQGKETSLLHTAASYQLLPPDWDLSARDSIEIKASAEETGPWHVQANLSLEDLVFQNKDGRFMGENIILNTGIEGDVDLERSSMTFAASLEANAGEALYDRYYLNLGENPIITSCNGSYLIREKSLQLSKLTFDLMDILLLEIQGRFKQDSSKADADFTVTIPQVSLKPIFHHLLQEPFKTEKPILATLETEGAVSTECRIKRFQNEWEVTGRLNWHGGALTSGAKNISFKGIYLDLPIWYRTGLAEAPVETLKGKLDVQSVTVPFLPEQSLSIPLDARPNRISVESPTKIRIPGGDLRLGSVQVKEPFGPDLSIHTSLSFDGIKLQPILSKIWTRPQEGTLYGKLDPVRYEGHAVTSHGEIKAEVFGGQILLSDLGASGIFAAMPVFKINVQGDDLLLSEITTDTSFGKIEGVLNGFVRDLEIAYGQPQAFDLLLETAKKPGISQRISVKALDNIAQLGGGQSPFMGLAGTFASIFKKFPYEKIGIRAHLVNDVFTINGTVREDGTEYLVKRGGFSGVNVVNQNPDNRISFKDMVKRIKRITLKGGLVVK